MGPPFRRVETCCKVCRTPYCCTFVKIASFMAWRTGLGAGTTCRWGTVCMHAHAKMKNLASHGYSQCLSLLGFKLCQVNCSQVLESVDITVLVAAADYLKLPLVLSCFRHMTVRVHTGEHVKIQHFSRADSVDAGGQMTITVKEEVLGAAATFTQHHLLCMCTSLQVRRGHSECKRWVYVLLQFAIAICSSMPTRPKLGPAFFIPESIVGSCLREHACVLGFIFIAHAIPYLTQTCNTVFYTN
jgi:hypothetical protein